MRARKWFNVPPEIDNIYHQYKDDWHFTDIIEIVSEVHLIISNIFSFSGKRYILLENNYTFVSNHCNICLHQMKPPFLVSIQNIDFRINIFYIPISSI